MSKFLLIDADNLCYRSFFTTGKTLDQGTTFGFLKELHTLKRTHHDYQFVFCWDHGRPKRLDLLPTYKSSRRRRLQEQDDGEKASLEAFRFEVDTLKHEILWDLGYANIRWQDGYEADDLLAEFVHRPPGGRVVIVSSDHDLYQLLEPCCSILKPQGHSPYTIRDFRKNWRIEPSQWHLVKSLAGCTSDDIPGVKGIGGITACKFLRGELKPTSGLYNRIMDNQELWLRNQRLVKLPYPGVRPWPLREDSVTKAKWRSVVRNLGMFSLIEMF